MTLSKLTILLVLLILATSDLVSQEVPPPPPPVRMGDGSGTGKKAPGATVRGRLVYEDTGAPIRYAMIGFSAVGSRGYASETVQTDENGNFVFENLAPGEYYPVVRNRGILNPEAFVDPTLSVAQRTEKLNRFFQKIAVEGTGEFEVFLRAKRGASISGVVRYFDGEAAVGVTVEALPVIDGFPLNRVFSGSQGPNSEKTDDRGFYRFAGLPEGQYVVRVTEPVTHRNEKVRYSGFLSNPFSENPFQTYYPAGSSNRNADRIDAFYGQTAEGVNITLPERNLYDVSGIVIRADTRQPLKNFEVTFTPVVVVDDDGEDETPKFSAKRLASLAMRSFGQTSYGGERPAEFSLLNLPPGKYLLTATQKASDRKDAPPGEPKPKYPTVSKEIEIVGSNLENVQIEIPVGARLTGLLVSEEGVPLNTYLSLTAFNEETGRSQRSRFVSGGGQKTDDSVRNFEFESVTAGKYRLSLSSASFYIREVRIGSEVQPGNVVEIENGNDLSDLKVVLASDLGTIKGTIRNFVPGTPTTVLALGTGQDIVTALSGGNVGRSAQVKSDGSFEIKTAPGEYSLILMTRSTAPRDPLAFLKWLEEMRVKAAGASVGPKGLVVVTLDLP